MSFHGGRRFRAVIWVECEKETERDYNYLGLYNLLSRTVEWLGFAHGPAKSIERQIDR